MNIDTISFLLGTITGLVGGIFVNLLSTDIQHWMAKGSFWTIRRFATPRLPSFLQDQYRDQWMQSCREHGPLTQFCIAMNCIRKAGLIRKGYPADLGETDIVINGKALRMDWQTAFACAGVIWLADKANQQDQIVKTLREMSESKGPTGYREGCKRVAEAVASAGPLKSIAFIQVDTGEGLEASLGPAGTPRAISPRKTPFPPPQSPRG